MVPEAVSISPLGKTPEATDQLTFCPPPTALSGVLYAVATLPSGRRSGEILIVVRAVFGEELITEVPLTGTMPLSAPLPLGMMALQNNATVTLITTDFRLFIRLAAPELTY
jgi:hypothetical protein